MKTRTLLRLFAAALVPVSALANACGDDDNAFRTGSDGGRSPDATPDAASKSDASTHADADADAGFDGPFPSPCTWNLRDGGTATALDGAVFEEPDTGVMPTADAGPSYPWDAAGSYPSDYCRAKCGDHAGSYGICKPAPGGQVWCHDCTGRRPAGFRRGEPVRDDEGSIFAEMARLEAASVVAFRTLARELAFHRAPKRLVRAAERAARDEIRHTRAMSALARRHGAKVVLDDIPAPPMRDLEIIARENAVEGCVHETWGALVAHHQARTARDPVVRAVMKRIARDETEHAALGWQIAAWVNGRLDRAACDRIARARRDAAARLLASVSGENRRLLVKLDARLWSSAAA